LNEPETSLNPELFPVLAERIVEAAQRSQLWVTTHAELLAPEIERRAGVRPLRLERVDGATRVRGLRIDGTVCEEDE
jgi:predicted ATPase